MQWLRLYADLLNNPKAQTLPGDLFKIWINCLCIACNADETFHGTLHETIDETAYALRLSKEDTQEALDRLVSARLLILEDGLYHIVNWDKRQFKSDTSTDRVKAFREKKKKQLGNVSVTPPDTEQNQIQRQNRTDKNIEPPEGVSSEVWSDFVKHRKAKRSAITRTALEGIEREALKAGWTLEAALSECCQRGWTGFKAEWVNKDQKGSNNGKSKSQLADEATERALRRLEDEENTTLLIGSSVV